MSMETYDNVNVVPYRHPGEFFHRNRDNEDDRVPVCCTWRKCGLCMMTLLICVGGGILVKYLIDRWGEFEEIS
jgi:hypothetical protein